MLLITYTNTHRHTTTQEGYEAWMVTGDRYCIHFCKSFNSFRNHLNAMHFRIVIYSIFVSAYLIWKHGHALYNINVTKKIHRIGTFATINYKVNGVPFLSTICNSSFSLVINKKCVYYAFCLLSHPNISPYIYTNTYTKSNEI